MMNTRLTINTAANTIEMTKEFAKKAKYFGTDEYNMLQIARKDYPTFSVTTKKTKSKENYKGLTLDYMKKYIELHPQTLVLEVLRTLVGLDENGEKIEDAETTSYGEIRAWFFGCYPEVKNKKEEKKANTKRLLTATKKKAA